MICTLDANDFCARHKVHHRGAAKAIAIDPSESAEKCRVAWDQSIATRSTVQANHQTRNVSQCKHLGQPTGETAVCKPCRRGANGTGTRISLHQCGLHAKCTIHKDAGDGTRCCATCKDREADKRIIVPMPPPLKNVTPRSDRAIVTVVAGANGRALWRISGPHMRAYAARVGADLVVLDWPGHPAWPMSSKFAIGRALDHYERIAYMDADIICRPEAVDLFHLCEPDEFGFHDELTLTRRHQQYNRQRSYNDARVRMGFERIESPPWYFNAGVMVVPKRYQQYLYPPKGPIMPWHCEEQDHTNARVLDAVNRGDVKYRLLDRRANWQNWTDCDKGTFSSAPPDAILHFSGGGEIRKRRRQDMQAYAERHPWFDPGPTEIRSWEIDTRHCYWLQALLATGRFKRALEIGCFHGYSTQAFLSVADRVDVHLCDVELRPQLAARIAGKRVQFHQRPSVDVLAEAGPFDLVFVDGDHRWEIVQQELRLMRAMGVRSIMAHDTADEPSMGIYPHCDGPGKMKAALRDAGYLCFEDAERRPQELTDRGMLWASLDEVTFHAGVEAFKKHASLRKSPTPSHSFDSEAQATT